MSTFSTENKSDVILHAFDWPYSDIADHAETISALGYKTVLVSPPMKSLKRKDGTPWWQRYQPQDYRVIDNQLGNTKDFFSMVKALGRHDVWVYADVVFNHMANEASIRPDLHYPGPTDMQHYLQQWESYQALTLFGDLREPLFTEDDFVEAFGIENWKDRWQVQNGRITGGVSDPGLPTLKDSDHVAEQQQRYIRALKGMGVRGFRIDAAKHMTLEHLKKVWTPEIVSDVHIFGEIITDGGATKEEYGLFLQPYLEHTRLAAYDFPLFNTVYHAFQPEGSLESLVNPYSLGQALSNSRAITFAITHDIPNNEVFQELILSEEEEWLAYAYILGRDGGVPLIYTDLNPSGIMNKQGIPRWKNSWKDPRMTRMIAFHNLMHGEQMFPILAASDCLIFSRGSKGLVAINKGRKTLQVNIDRKSSMLNLLDDERYFCRNGEVIFTLQPKSCMMLADLEWVSEGSQSVQDETHRSISCMVRQV